MTPSYRYPLPDYVSPARPIPDYLVSAARQVMARRGVYLNPQARAWVLSLAEWRSWGVCAFAEDLPPDTADAVESIRKGLVTYTEVGVYPNTRPGYHLTVCGVVWVQEQSKIPQQMPLFDGGMHA